MIGTVLGSYRITGELSAGGMGQVYKADHTVLGRHAAVKFLRGELSQNTEVVQRFFNEAKAATAIRHPGIIEVFDFGYTDEGRAYIIMELLEGEPLSHRIARGPLPEVDATQIARGIASALVAAHDKGIVHRDLKPDNVFLVPDPDVPLGERPKVLDFGIAKLGDQLPKDLRHTVTGALIGTPLYMAPEQARAAAKIDARADLYSLGCMLYEMLVGKPPFVAEGAGELIALHMFGKAEAPSARGVAVSPELEAITMRLLEKEPRDRFANAGELVDALGRVLQKLDVRVSQPMPAQPVTQPVAQTLVVEPPRRSHLPLIAGAVTAVLAGAVAMVIVRTMHRDAEPPPPKHETIAAPVAQPQPPAPVQAEQLPTPPPVTETIDKPKPPPVKAKHLKTDNGSPIEDKL
jgi:serine/threonine protein kinase